MIRRLLHEFRPLAVNFKGKIIPAGVTVRYKFAPSSPGGREQLYRF
jgi:hypothetical protein